jgi:4-hydroxy-3-polyprenylbenzoate decarboxylase
MSLRAYLKSLEEKGAMLRVGKPISKVYEIAGLLKQTEPNVVLCKQIKESRFPVIGNLFCTKADFAAYFGIEVSMLIPTLTQAITQRSPCQVASYAHCQEVVIDTPDLNTLPILKHCEKDGGNYISSGVFIAKHPKHGQNVDFHRCMQFSKTEMAVRVVKNRNFDTFLQDLGAVDVAICVGVPPNVLAAAATSVEIGINELEIANALEPLPVVRAKTVDVLIPAQAEFVIEGTVYRDKRHAEGPFVDLTETYDVIREEPVLEVKTITHRRDAIWHALLPGALEHKLLMGMPREPTIFQHVNEVVDCLDVHVNPGGCSWLHAIVQIDKQHHDDGIKAIRAAFSGHSSCKHIFVVDGDIDIYDPLSVEWAFATRFQADRDLVTLDRAPGSSLDPSAEAGTKLTTRAGFDLTKPLKPQGKNFEKAPFPQMIVDDYIE